MRKENMCITERDLMFAIGGQLFNQAPNRQPRKAEIIMTKVRDAFRKDAYNNNEYYTLVIDVDKLKKYIHDLLFSIPEFEELNLSQIEFENNVSVDDENRPKFSFSSRYDKYNYDSWKRDFIDLDAFLGNVLRNIYMIKDFETDCFCCAHEKTDKCNTCIVNPNLEINYEGSRQPKGKYTFACKYDCYRSRYICCEECDDKGTCSKKCDGNSQNCGIAIKQRD